MTNEATRIQNAAADPRGSAWLSANAGSGKTRVLTDRVARLLLRGTRPQDILCLTYTKAAAAEMQNRLFRTLGEWAMMPDADLTAALDAIGEGDQADLERARTLFARAIETPGGLRIQTIHSFCAGLMRQFPVEAGVAPDFRELDTAEAAELLALALDQMADETAPELAQILKWQDGDAMQALCMTLAGARTGFAEPVTLDQIADRLGVPPGRDRAECDAALLALVSPDWWQALREAIRGTGKRNDEIAARMAVEATGLTARDLDWIDKTFGNATNDNSKAGKWPAKAVRNTIPAFCDPIDAFLDGVIDRRLARRGVDCRDRTLSAHRFARALLARYENLKRERGVLDFDDLIEKTSALLNDDSRAWVRFRLDGRIEHILVDEAQDTSPEQWRVIAALAEEIVSGQGAGPEDRSLFVVGDRKQSIYSFQGADAAAFDAMQSHFADRMADGPQPLAHHRLQFSFRSSTAILRAADAVLGSFPGTGHADETHRAFFDDLPGRVDVWPVFTPSDAAEDVEWFDPVDRPLEEEAQIRLADAVAHEIKRLIEEESIPRAKGGPRPVHPGDILVLVQRRSAIFERIIRTAQSLGVEIAGPDRLHLLEEVAVKDILALLRFLALPDDCLSLAEALRSPIFGLGEAALYDLAAGRGDAGLWQVLRGHPDHGAVNDILSDLLAKSDYLRPYEIIERILIRHGGRERLIGRLGPDAEDAIDELLALALRFEETGIPDLTSFLGHLEGADFDIKRAPEASGRKVRVMTVHGAKGLEAPIVILPDTIRVDRADQAPLFHDEDGFAFLRSASADATELQRAAVARKAAAERAEAERLLYVAMTRAETWLIVCGAELRVRGGFWHEAISDALANLGETTTIDTPAGEGLRLAHGTWPLRGDAPATGADATPPLPPLPALPPPPALAAPLNPSDAGGRKSAVGGPAREDAKDWGTAIHLLLEHLPGQPAADHAALSERLLANAGIPAERVDPARAQDTASRVIADHPELFGPDALREVPLGGWADGVEIAGTIDLLLIGEGKVRLVDFKTNAVVPGAVEDVPPGILRQMAAYAMALRSAMPDHQALLQILWTEDGSLMTLPDSMLRAERFEPTTS